MNSQTVLDNVNKYRFGVLVGNQVEERFGFDMANRERNEKIPTSVMKQTIGMQNSFVNAARNIIPEEQKEYVKMVKYNPRGIQNHLLVGHGVNQNDKDYATTYDLSFNQKVKPTTQIYSKFQPDQTLNARPFNKNTVYEKQYQQQIPEMGGKTNLNEKIIARPYGEYIKTFDSTSFKIPLRK